MVSRLSKDEYYKNIALAVSKRSTCLKRRYGCIIVQNDEIIATGYNGSPRGEENCCDRGTCNRLHIPHNSGDYGSCFAVHAEMNALLSAQRRDVVGATMYIACEEVVDGEWVPVAEKSEPCPICSKMIRNAGIEDVR